MGAGDALVVMALALGLSGCGLFQGQDPENKALDQTDAILIVLDANQPDLSKGVLYDPKAPFISKMALVAMPLLLRGADFRKGSRHWGRSK